jgi:phenylacetate-coenzyme A ligase PaaK-like adenylate-forming protein
MSGFGTLDAWVGRTIGLDRLPHREDIDAWQLRCLRQSVAHARARSPFYRLRPDWPEAVEFSSLDDLADLPLTTPDDLVKSDPSLIALPMRDAARLVTIPTSGTSGATKRLFFTEEDIEAMVAYFEHGMATIVRPGSVVAIAFPAERPDSVGDLLMRGLTRLGAVPEALPVGGSLEELATALRRMQPAAIAGMPVTLGAMARHMASDGGAPLAIEMALVSADSVSPSFKAALAVTWGTEIFEHWGMTETGYGGALACDAHDGLHIRETDLHVEIVDIASGRSLPAGEDGEVVISTLRRRGLPLIRYRTGDRGRLIAAPCRCGSVLRRLHLAGRIDDFRLPNSGEWLPVDVVHDAIFSVETVIDFAVELRSSPKRALVVSLRASGEGGVDKVGKALLDHPVIGPALRAEGMDITVTTMREPYLPLIRKRRLMALGK